jgi:hypothetical protein
MIITVITATALESNRRISATPMQVSLLTKFLFLFALLCIFQIENSGVFLYLNTNLLVLKLPRYFEAQKYSLRVN